MKDEFIAEGIQVAADTPEPGILTLAIPIGSAPADFYRLRAGRLP